MTTSQDIYRGFTDVDQAARPESLHAFLEAVDATPEFLQYKRELRPRLELGPGQTMLDVGCGIGIEACRLAKQYPDVSVIGMDRAAMLDEAERRASELGVDVRWLAGEAEAIPLPDNSVDACATERVLMYLPDASAGIAEMVRVLKPRGRIVSFEFDYEATIVGGDPAVAEPVRELLAASVGEPRMGRRLPALFNDAGLVDISYQTVDVNPRGAVYEATVADPVRNAIAEGRLDEAPARAWLEDQEAALNAGLLSVTFIAFLASGRLEAAMR